jgi:hypothetical protein
MMDRNDNPKKTKGSRATSAKALNFACISMHFECVGGLNQIFDTGNAGVFD